MAAPTATTSSGLTPLCPSLPNTSFTSCCTRGIRVMPPTITTSSMSAGFIPASPSAFSTGVLQRSIRCSTIRSNCARVTLRLMCRGTPSMAVMNGRFTSAFVCVLRYFFTFSASSFSRCIAIGSFRRSTWCSFLNSSAMWSISTLSKSSPPRWVSPLVLFTWKFATPSISYSSRMEMSNVPPPRSNTAIFWSLPFLSNP